MFQRWRRALPIAFAAAPSVIIFAVMLLVLPGMNSFLGERILELMSLIEALYQSNPPAASHLQDPEVRDAFETYLVGKYETKLNSDDFWNTPIMQSLRDRREIARKAMEHHPSVSAEELARASALIAPNIEYARQKSNMSLRDLTDIATIVLGTLVAIPLLLALGCSLVSAVCVPGGVVMRMLGLAVVTRNGTEITRLRSLGRAVVAWLPAILWLGFLMASAKIQGWVPAPSSLVPTAALLGTLTFGAIWAIARPRGLHDRISGPWIMPR